MGKVTQISRKNSWVWDTFSLPGFNNPGACPRGQLQEPTTSSVSGHCLCYSGLVYSVQSLKSYCVAHVTLED